MYFYRCRRAARRLIGVHFRVTSSTIYSSIDMMMSRSVGRWIDIDTSTLDSSFLPSFLTSHLDPSFRCGPNSPFRLFLIPMQNADAGRRKMGLLGAKRTTITVHRSEEILPPWRPGGLGAAAAATDGLARTGTSVSSGEGGDGDLSGEGSER